MMRVQEVSMEGPVSLGRGQFWVRPTELRVLLCDVKREMRSQGFELGRRLAFGFPRDPGESSGVLLRAVVMNRLQ